MIKKNLLDMAFSSLVSFWVGSYLQFATAALQDITSNTFRFKK
jgi:hypothetical protein